MRWQDFQVAGWLPEQSTPRFAVSRFTIDAATHHDLTGRSTGTGEFTRIVEHTPTGDVLWMSDTRAEIDDHLEFFTHIYPGSHPLITGLGIGMAAAAAIALGARAVTVVEKDQDVINLIAPHLDGYALSWGAQLQVVCADATTWDPPEGAQFSCAWHDIWPTIGSENVPQMRSMMRRYAPHVGGWQGCWSMADSQMMARMEWKMQAGADLTPDEVAFGYRTLLPRLLRADR